MYGQNNYTPQIGQSANASGPPSQQWPHAPATPPSAAQVPRPPMLPYGPPLGPQGGQRGPPTYQHGHPGLRHPSPPFLVPTGVSNSNQYYAMPHPPLPSAQVHGNAPILQPHQVPGQHAQWSSSMHHIPPVAAPGAPRVLPPPPPYRGAVHQPSPDGMPVFLHNLPPPPPLPPPSNSQNSGSSTPAPSDGSMHPRSHDSPVPPTVFGTQPPLPPSPPGDPPLPPSSPSLISSTAAATILSSTPGITHSSLAKQSVCHMSSHRSSGVDGMTFNSVDNFVATDSAANDEGFEHDRGIICTEVLPVDKNLTSDLPPPPKSVSLAFPGESSSLQLINSINSGPSDSAADSDMEMEDDITQLDEHQQIHSVVAEKQLKDSVTEDILHQNLSFHGHLEPEEQRQDSSYPAPSRLKELSSEAIGLNRGNEALSDDHVRTLSSLREDLSRPSASPVKASSSLRNDLSHPGALSTDRGVDLENVHNQLMHGASPFRLIQGYASDDSLDNDNENCIEDDGPLTVPLPSEVVTTSSKTNAGKSSVSSVKPSSVAKDDKESCAALNFEGSVDDSDGNQLSVKSYTVPGGSHQENISGIADRDSFDLCKEDAKDDSATQKVDAFGRLVREGIRESDSDDSPTYRRRHRKRGRSRSRSRSLSPHDRRRRRSPWKRKERRGRSRSISPKRRRSRSKSPSRNGLTSGGDKMRRDRGHPPQCFDFLRGKCYRGASCRYFHAEPDRSDRSRSYRSKHQDQDLLPISKDSDKHYSKDLYVPKDSDTQEKFGTTHKELVKDDKSKSQDIPDMEVKDLKESEATSHLYVKENHKELTASPVNVAEVEKLLGEAAGSISSSIGTLGIKLAEDHVSDQMLQNAGDKLVEKCDSSIPLSSSVQKSLMASPVQLPQFLSAKELCPSSVLQPPYLSASFSSLPQASSTAFAQQMPRDHYLAPPFNSVYTENVPSYQAPFPHQQSPFAIPLSSSWNSLPPRPGPSQPPHSPFANESSGKATGGQHSVPGVHFQQHIVPRNDFTSQTSVGPYASTLPSIPQVGEHHAYVQTQPNYTRGSPTSRRPNFLGERLPLGDLPGPSSKTYPYMQQSAYGPLTADISQHLLEPGPSSSGSRYTSDLLDQNRAPLLPDFGSRISSHFNPYASTFDQPLTTKFSSGQIHERDMLPSNAYNASFRLSNMPTDGHPEESLDSRNITPPQPSARAAEEMFPRPGGSQYDPLFDSIEPSTNPVKKSSPSKKREVTDDSGALLRLSRFNEPLDVEVNKSQKAGASSENDEYGETAEAEVGAVENGSLSDSSDGEDVPTGEIEIEQVKPSAEKKKSKDSRSMKLFKISVANFVKELLKPSWRQGNMSKEVFKTIVKKTVDKVSGAMKSRHPKSKAKIDHYIDSSQRKLTKLVMGYVDKYVKA